MSQQFCLKWNNHMNNMMEVFKDLLSKEAMVDVTLACDGLSLKAHKMVLSACSPFFQALFRENPCKHPIVILKDMKYTELKAIIEFMYHGEVNVAQDQLSALMKTAETLRVKGLAEVNNDKPPSNQSDEPSQRSTPRSESPQSKRRRGRVRKRSFSDSNRSDDSNEPKIKAPSPDIEELSCDATMDNSSGQFSNLPPQVPMQQTHSQNSFHKSVVSQDPHIEEPASADESEFGVEPAKLLEQTLTTDDLSNQRRNRSQMSSMEMQRRPRSSTDHSSNMVPVSSMPSDMGMGGSQMQPESPPDIKPEILDLEPPMSPVAGPSHSADNSMMMYMDQSSLSSHPGTSGGSYQDNTALVPTDSQPQESILPLLMFCIENNDDLQNQELPKNQEMPQLSNQIIPHSKLHFRKDGSEKLKAEKKLKPHKKPRKEEQNFICSVCSKTFKTMGRLSRHLSVHNKENFFCTVCDKTFKAEKNLKLHEEQHFGEPKFTCNICSKKFIRKNILNRHMKNHNKERTFSCSVCDKKFKYNFTLQHHLITHIGEKPFSCNLCKQKFVLEKSLTCHLKTHTKEKTQFSCHMCDKKFNYMSTLKSHLLIHLEVKPYSCDVCRKNFNHVSNFRRHLLTHTGEKPYSCDVCSQKFAHMVSLKNHMPLHFSEESTTYTRDTNL